MIGWTVPSAAADNTKLGPVTNILKGHAAVWRHLSKLEKRADRKIEKGHFRKGMYNILLPGAMHHSMLGTDQLESRFADKDLGVLVVTKLTIS